MGYYGDIYHHNYLRNEPFFDKQTNTIDEHYYIICNGKIAWQI